MIAFCIWIRGKTKISVISVTLHDGEIRKKNYRIRFYVIFPLYGGYLDVQVLQNC